MKFLFRLAEQLSHYMHIISGFLLVGMMVTVLMEVISRAVFGATSGNIDFTFIGGVEIVSYCLLFSVLFALPYSVEKGQVIVDLFTDGFSDRAKDTMSGLYTFGFGILGFGMSLKFYHATITHLTSYQTTQDLLIPMYYLYAISAFAAGVLAVRGTLVSVEKLLHIHLNGEDATDVNSNNGEAS